MDRRVADLEMIRNLHEWPSWPLLPLKRDWDQQPSYGIIVDAGLSGPLVWLPGTNIWDYHGLPPREEWVVLDPKKIENLLDEGWTVD